MSHGLLAVAGPWSATGLCRQPRRLDSIEGGAAPCLPVSRDQRQLSAGFGNLAELDLADVEASAVRWCSAMQHAITPVRAAEEKKPARVSLTGLQIRLARRVGRSWSEAWYYLVSKNIEWSFVGRRRPPFGKATPRFFLLLVIKCGLVYGPCTLRGSCLVGR